MSWLSRSLSDDRTQPVSSSADAASPPAAVPQGVRHDLSDLNRTLSRQLLGMASFLAPPAATATTSDVIGLAEGEEPRSDGVADAAAAPISGISNAASGSIPPSVEAREEAAAAPEEDGVEEESDKREVVGITDEVLAFAKNISRYPETWLDFPLLGDDEDEPNGLFSYFDMSDAQLDHALTVEHLTPGLAALRMELCPCHVSEECFWKIYFVLLHPRLNKHDAELLCTPQIVEARSIMQQLQSTAKRSTEDHLPSKQDLKLDQNPNTADEIAKSRYSSAVLQPKSTDSGADNHPAQTDKSDSNEHVATILDLLAQKVDEIPDDWFDTEVAPDDQAIPVADEHEDISFSDLEDDSG